MISKNLLASAVVSAAVLFHFSSSAQSIANGELNMTPLTINPAFTGMFNGNVRVMGIYNSQWSSAFVPFKNYYASVDLPVYTGHNGNYLATGLSLDKSVAGDGEMANFTGIASLAYHRHLRSANDTGNTHCTELAAGIQGSYNQATLDLADLYFGRLLQSHIMRLYGVRNSVSYFGVNAGISFSKAICPRFSFTAGIAGYNLNQPGDAIEVQQYRDLGINTRYVGVLSADWKVSNRVIIRPGILYQEQRDVYHYFSAGGEVSYALRTSTKKFCATSVFLGYWEHTIDVMTFAAGIDHSRFRLGIGYDYNLVPLTTASSGLGGFTIQLRYVTPGNIRDNKRSISRLVCF